MLAVVQDVKSGVVIDVIKKNQKYFSELEIGSFLDIDNVIDIYEIKNILPAKSGDSCIIKVNTHRKSEHFRVETIYGEENINRYAYLRKMEDTIEEVLNQKADKTHIRSILKGGVKKVAKKFGEESVELVIESGKNNEKNFINEAADVLYYFLILVHERGYQMRDVLKALKKQKRRN